MDTRVSYSAAELSQYGMLSCTGDEARAFLHAQLTSDVAALGADSARRAGWCSAKGRLLATFLVIPYEGGYLLQLSRDLAAPVAKRLAMFILRAKVKLAEASGEWTQLGIWGPSAIERLRLLGLDEPLAELGVTRSAGALAVRLAAQRFLVAVPAAQRAATLAGLANAGPGAWALEEIRAGQPMVMQATQDQFVPQMVNLELAGGVDFHKGCYPGQEVVARAQYRGAVKRRMVRLRGAALRPGQELYSDDQPGQASGTVVNAAGEESLAVLSTATIEAGAPVRAQPGAAPLERLPLPYSR